MIAREYGFQSWSELRQAVAAGSSTFSEANVRMLMTFALGSLPNWSEDVFTAMRAAHAARELAESASAAALPERLPLLGVRDALLLRPSIVPLQVARPASWAALRDALAKSPPTLVAFAQRRAIDEEVHFGNLHPIGCQVLLHEVLPGGDGPCQAIVEALRLVELRGVDPAEANGARYARIAPFTLDTSTEAAELPELERRLRSCARRLAATLPDPEAAISTIDALDQLDLASSIVQNLPRSVEDKAQFAIEPQLVEKLRLALRWAESFGIL